MGTPPIRVLGEVAIDDPAADRGLGRGQARELLGYLVARRRAPATTDDIVHALWGDDPPATAATIVHGLVRRIRRALGAAAVLSDRHGYHLGPGVDDVDLWSLLDLIEAGELAGARARWREPAFGPYADRRWARAAAEPARAAVEPDPEALLRTRRRVPVRRLIGRRRELAAVQAGLRHSRVVTIVGMGGVGKTRLALEVARDVDGRVTHIDVGAAVGPVASRVATELGQASSGDAATDLRSTASLIGREPRLLIVDGCDDDLAGSASVVEHLVASCPQVTVLATSRVALGIPGEQVVPLLPFADPTDPRGDTVELLLDRVRAMGWEPGPADREAALDVSHRTAGVPLAIELGAVELLVASRTPAAPPASSTPEAAVTSAVEGAIAQLSDATRVTAARASRLVAGFTTRMVPSLVPAGASSTSVVQELVAGGLVAVETSGTSRRLRFLDRVRAGLLDASSDDNDADDAALALVLDLLQQVRPDLAQPPVIPALAEAIDELANVDALLSQVEAAHRSSDHVALAVAAADTWQEDGQWSSGARRLEAAVAASADLDPLTRAGAVRAWAAVTSTYDGVRRLIPELEDAAKTARDAGDVLLEAHLRFQLANAHGYAGHTSEAVQAAARLRELARVVDSEYVDLGVQSLDGAGRLMAGDHEGSRRTLDRAAARLEVLGALSDAARTHRMSSLASRAAGELDVAIGSLRDAERLASAALARGTLATVRSDLTDVRLQVGDPLAAAALEAALDAALAVGNLRAAGIVRLRLGVLHRDTPTIARGTLDLWFADRRRAAAALVHLAAGLDGGHELRAVLEWAVPAMAAGWGTPLDGEDQALVAPHLESTEVAPADWEARLEGLLQEVAQER